MRIVTMLTAMALLSTGFGGAAHAQGVQFGSGTAEGPGWRGGWVGGSIGDPGAAQAGIDVAAGMLSPWLGAPEPDPGYDAAGDTAEADSCLYRVRVHGRWRLVDRCR